MDNHYNPTDITYHKNMRCAIVSYFIDSLNNESNPDLSFIIRINEEVIRRKMKKDLNNTNLIKHIINNNSINDDKCYQLYNLSNDDEFTKELNALLIFVQLSKEINKLINKYESNLGYLDESDIIDFKNNIKNNNIINNNKLNNSHILYNLFQDKFQQNSNLYFNHFILHTFINRCNKNKMKAINNNKYIDICSTTINPNIINNNINKLIKVALK